MFGAVVHLLFLMANLRLFVMSSEYVGLVTVPPLAISFFYCLIWFWTLAISIAIWILVKQFSRCHSKPFSKIGHPKNTSSSGLQSTVNLAPDYILEDSVLTVVRDDYISSFFLACRSTFRILITFFLSSWFLKYPFKVINSVETWIPFVILEFLSSTVQAAILIFTVCQSIKLFNTVLSLFDDYNLKIVKSCTTTVDLIIQ